MEIKGPGRITTVSRKGKKRRSSKAEFGKNLSVEETTAAAPPSGTSPLTAVSSLLSLQEMPSGGGGRREGMDFANHLLGRLEMIRHGLLAGQIPRHSLKDIEKVVSRQRSLTNDPALDEILADMELRVRVELAKLERS